MSLSLIAINAHKFFFAASSSHHVSFSAW